MTTLCPPQGYTIVAKPFLLSTEVDESTHTTILDDDFLPVTYPSTGEVTITLSDESTIAGNQIVIKDASGNAINFNITIDTESTQKIDGQDIYVIIGNYDSVTLVCDGTDWWLV